MKINKHKSLLACLILLVIFITACQRNGTNVSYEFTAVRRGSIERTVSASGRINPVSTVRVLPQMSGKVERILVDFNDTVQKGDVLAELNTDTLLLRRQQQHASVVKARANYELQLLNYNNQLVMAERNLISEFELRTSRTNLDNLAADLAVAEANLLVIDTEINQFAYITSPIDGIVLDRSINEGDTVSDSSNNSNSIFILAENLSEMQIEATVGELDVTSIHRGQPVRFTLESLPGRTFSGVVETLRLIPAVMNNVVSYTVIIRVENHDGSLLPGMTCAVEFIVERNDNTLIVSNSALRFQPTNLSSERINEMVFEASLDNMNEDQRTAAMEARNQTQTGTAQTGRPQQTQGVNTGITGMLTGNTGGRGGFPGMMMMPGGGVQGSVRSASPAVWRNLWYISDSGNLEVMQVMTGISSGSFTEILTLDSDIEGRQFIQRERI